MAVKTKRHIQRLYLLHFHHLIDPAVAAYAAHTGGHVGLMVEEHEIGNPVNTYPLDGFAGRDSSRGLFRVGGFAASPACDSSCRSRSEVPPHAAPCLR